MDSSKFSVSPVIARENELGRLSQWLERACTDEGKIVFVRGTMGSGKTTLLREFVRRAAAKNDLLIAMATCQEYVGVTDPYRPFIQLLHALFDNTHATPDLARALIEQGPDLLDLFIPSAWVFERAQKFSSGDAPWRDLLSERAKTPARHADARAQEIELSDQITRVLQTLAQKFPVMILIDDLQWADSASLGLLFHLGQELSDNPVLLIGAYHTEEIAAGKEGKPHPLESVLQEWQRDQRYAEIDLDRADGQLFADEYLASQPNRLSQNFRDSMLIRTRGHPAFTIEWVQNLIERRELAQDETGAWIESSTFQWMQLPTNMQAMVAERLGRLPTDLQNTLTVASIQGEVFSAQTLAEAQEIDAITLADQLDLLENQFHMIAPLGNGQYRFAHAWFRRVLYQNVDSLKRARLHQAVGQSLEKNYSGQADPSELAAQLAWHFDQAAQASSAARFALHAGRRANRFSAYTEAITLFYRGLQWLSVLPQNSERDEKEIELRLALHSSLAATQGYASAELRQSLERLQELCDQTGEIAVVISALLHLADFYNLRSELDAATQVAQHALELAQRVGDSALVVWARHSLALTLLHRGDLTASRQQWESSSVLENALGLHSPSVGGIDARVARRMFSALVFWLLGYPDKASELVQDAISIAQILDHRVSLAAAWNTGGAMLDIFCQDYKSLPERITTVLQLANQYELSSDQASASIFHGRLLAKLGRIQDGIQMMYRGLAARQAGGLAMRESFYMELLAETYTKASRPKQAQHALSEAIMSAHETGERFWESELYRLVGETLLQGESPTQPTRGLFQAFATRIRRPSLDNVELDELLNLPWDDPRRPTAEYCFERAIQVAEKQQAKLLELRATVSLCRLWMQQDKRRQAQQKLSALLKWFSEGFETQDLKDAKTLLNSLSE